MRCGINHHRLFIGRIIGDEFVHVKEIAVFFGDDFFAVAFDGVGKIKINRTTGHPHAFAGIALRFGCPRSHISGHEVSKTGVFLFQIIIAIFFGDILGITDVARIVRYPHAAVVSEAFTHQGQLGLMIAGMRNAGRMDLSKTGIGEHRPLFIGAKYGADIGRFSIGGKVIYIAVPPGGQYDRIGGMTFEFSVDQISNHNAAGLSVNDDHIQHFTPGE